MSTRSNVLIELPDGQVKAIYVHSDGYTSGVGKILMNSYNSYDKALKLFDYGDASYLDDTIDTCSFYSRDWNRGDEENKTRTYKSERTYMYHMAGDIFIEFIYIFKNGQWFVSFLSSVETKNGYEKSLFYFSKFELLSENKEYIKSKSKKEKHTEVKMLGQITKVLTGSGFNVEGNNILFQGQKLKKTN